MWPAKGTSPSLDMNNGVGNLLENPSYYYKTYHSRSVTPSIQQDVSTAFASSFDLIDINEMVLEKKGHMSWNSDEFSVEWSSSFNFSSYPTPSSHSGGFNDSLSSPVSEQKASKFPERQFSDFITTDIEKFLREANFDTNIWKYDSDTTYTKDDFDFDFCSSPEILPQAEIATEPSFMPSRSSTPVDSPENTFRHIEQFQFTQQTDQNNGIYFPNYQKQEHGPWGSPARTRPLQQFNYQNDRPIKSRVTKKLKPMVDYCVFCFNNGEVKAVYDSHTVRDSKGRCLCPTLRKYECPICHKDGDEAHTLKYCKEKKILTEEDMRRPVRRHL